MTAQLSLSVCLWGTRGTVAPHVPSALFGNHTTSIEVSKPGFRPLFADLGTGAAAAVEKAMAAGLRTFDIYLTHLHLDHLTGALACPAFFHRECRIAVHGAHARMEEAVRTLMSPPYIPVAFDDLAAEITFHPLRETGTKELPEQGFSLCWGRLMHPQGCTGFRFDDGENAIVLATDVEIDSEHGQDDLVDLLSRPYPAGLALIDGFFLDSEIVDYRDWGHSTWRQVRDLATQVGVETVLITHHHPRRTDHELRQEQSAVGGKPLWARDGQLWTLRGNHAEPH